MPTQQTALKAFKKNPDVVPDKLSNLLVEDCNTFLLEDLIKNQRRKNTILYNVYSKFFDLTGGADFEPTETGFVFYDGVNDEQGMYFLVISLLSRTPDGQAVMSFLDVKVDPKKSRDLVKWNLGDRRGIRHVLDEIDDEIIEEIIESIAKDMDEPQTLDHLLYREFTEALRVGKTFDQSLAIINKLYLQHFYV